MFCSHFGAAVADIQQIQRDTPRKKFLEILYHLFSQPELRGKRETK